MYKLQNPTYNFYLSKSNSLWLVLLAYGQLTHLDSLMTDERTLLESANTFNVNVTNNSYYNRDIDSVGVSTSTFAC